MMSDFYRLKKKWMAENDEANSFLYFSSRFPSLSNYSGEITKISIIFLNLDRGVAEIEHNIIYRS